MKENSKCFINTKTGNYEEITYKELEDRRTKYAEYRSKKFIKLSGFLLEVSDSEYKLFESDANRLRHINRAERKLKYFSYDQENEINYKDIIPDLNCDVEQEVERKLELEKLHDALLKLDKEEYELIKALYYDEKTLREYGKDINKHCTTIEFKRDKILEKIKEIMEN